MAANEARQAAAAAEQAEVEAQLERERIERKAEDRRRFWAAFKWFVGFRWFHDWPDWLQAVAIGATLAGPIIAVLVYYLR